MSRPLGLFLHNPHKDEQGSIRRGSVLLLLSWRLCTPSSRPSSEDLETSSANTPCHLPFGNPCSNLAILSCCPYGNSFHLFRLCSHCKFSRESVGNTGIEPVAPRFQSENVSLASIPEAGSFDVASFCLMATQATSVNAALKLHYLFRAGWFSFNLSRDELGIRKGWFEVPSEQNSTKRSGVFFPSLGKSPREGKSL